MRISKEDELRKIEINSNRSLLMKKYLSPEEITMEDRELALQELADQGDRIPDLYNFVFRKMYEMSKTRKATTHELKAKFGISDLAAELLVDKVSKDVGQVFNVGNEIVKQFNLMDYHIARLSELLESDTDLDVSSLTAELRMWVDMKTKALNAAVGNNLEHKKVQVEERKADAINQLSNEEILRYLEKLN